VRNTLNFNLTRSYTNIYAGGAICGAFIVFGGLSVLLYKPWRRRVDRKRVRNAHFEPLPQNSEAQRDDDEELVESPTVAKKGVDETEINIEPVQSTDTAGPAGSSAPR
jgi:high-affinity nickel-transport protein